VNVRGYIVRGVCSNCTRRYAHRPDSSAGLRGRDSGPGRRNEGHHGAGTFAGGFGFLLSSDSLP